MRLFGETVDNDLLMDNEPEKETCEPCGKMPDGGRMGRCCGQREGCGQSLQAGRRQEEAGSLAGQRRGAQATNWWGTEVQALAGAGLAAWN